MRVPDADPDADAWWNPARQRARAELDRWLAIGDIDEDGYDARFVATFRRDRDRLGNNPPRLARSLRGVDGEKVRTRLMGAQVTELCPDLRKLPFYPEDAFSLTLRRVTRPSLRAIREHRERVTLRAPRSPRTSRAPPVPAYPLKESPSEKSYSAGRLSRCGGANPDGGVCVS
jgi:hypothetical protein